MALAFAARRRRRGRRQPQARGLRGSRRRDPRRIGRRALRVACHVGDWDELDAARRGRLRATSAASTCWSTTPACRRCTRRCAEVTEDALRQGAGREPEGSVPTRRRWSARAWRPATAARSSTSAASPRVQSDADETARTPPPRRALNTLTVGFAHAFGPKVRVNCIMAGAVPHRHLEGVGPEAVAALRGAIRAPARRRARRDRRAPPSTSPPTPRASPPAPCSASTAASPSRRRDAAAPRRRATAAMILPRRPARRHRWRRRRLVRHRRRGGVDRRPVRHERFRGRARHVRLPGRRPGRRTAGHDRRRVGGAANQRLQEELRRSDSLYSNALLLARVTGIRIGECIHLPMDCLRHLGPEQWALHVPLGKLHTERLVPLDC